MTPSPSTAFPVRGSPSRLAPIRWQPIDPHVASMRRHPSSAIEPGPACSRCRFQPPAREQIVPGLAGIPLVWQAHLDRHPDEPNVAVDVARLRDELHAVTNRITRILDVPAAITIADVEIDAPTALVASTPPEHLVALLRLAAERASTVVGRFAPADWHRRARLGDKIVDVEALAILPLHRSHARLGGWRPCR